MASQHVDDDDIGRRTEPETPNEQLSYKDEEERAGGPKFTPPVYRQRYERAADFVREYATRNEISDPLKVVDFGCAEMAFVSNLKSVEEIGEIICVDVDRENLQRNIWKAGPAESDYLSSRSRPLKTRVFCGSVIEWDDILHGVDVVTAIELIEHLYDDVLSDFPLAVFGHLRPGMAVITTPNSDFNSLFPNLGAGFRHWDHKFEWTRQQFEDWCNQCARLYGYSCEFSGVGEPGSFGNLEVHGHCSQIAVFRRLDSTDRSILRPSGGQVYEKMAEFDFPCEWDGGDDEETKLLRVLEHDLNAWACSANCLGSEKVFVHVSRVSRKMKAVRPDIERGEMRFLLEKGGFDVRSMPPSSSPIIKPAFWFPDMSLGDFYVRLPLNGHKEKSYHGRGMETHISSSPSLLHFFIWVQTPMSPTERRSCAVENDQQPPMHVSRAVLGFLQPLVAAFTNALALYLTISYPGSHVFW